MQTADNAIVNVPLVKRGDLAAMAARAVRDEAVARERRFKAARAAGREAFAEAKRLIALVSDDRMAALGAPYKMTAKQTRAQFVSAARSNPSRVIASMKLETA